MGLELSQVSFSYASAAGGRPVFEDVDAHFESGRMYAVTGPSGSGKTTLFRLSSGELAATSGQVCVDGVDITSVDATTLRRSLVTRVYQEYRLIPYLDARDNVRLPQEVAGTLRSAPDRADVLLERLGLGARARSAVATLSGGEQQRVAIARALVMEPRVILADEPTGALDEDATQDIVRLLADVAHSLDVVVVVATHDPTVAGHADTRLHVEHRGLVEVS